MSGNELTEVDVTYVRDTELAILVRDADDRKVWLPKSEISLDAMYIDLEAEQIIEVTLPVWLAERTGLV